MRSMSLSGGWLTEICNVNSVVLQLLLFYTLQNELFTAEQLLTSPKLLMIRRAAYVFSVHIPT